MKTKPAHSLYSCIAALVVLGGCGADGADAAGDLDNAHVDEQANIFSSECTPNPCANGGTCADTLLGFECTCTGGFGGTLCDIAPGTAYKTCNHGYECGNSTTCPGIGVCTKLCASSADCPAPPGGTAICYENYCMQTCPPASGQCGSGQACSPPLGETGTGNDWLCYNAVSQ